VLTAVTLFLGRSDCLEPNDLCSYLIRRIPLLFCHMPFFNRLCEA